ncbi:MAG: glycosyltransferase family 2 protein [Planctomycetales bacterium]|nr:glycosyltransferase family 2 protein [Planctomycetales bacterium]
MTYSTPTEQDEALKLKASSASPTPDSKSNPTASPTSDLQYVERINRTLDDAETTLREAEDVGGLQGEAPCGVAQKLSVAIVIPAFNERDTIAAIVERVRQIGIHDEIVIVDDYSTDGTRDVLLELAKADDVRIEMHGYNRGKGAALRTGFRCVQSDVVMIQDADLEYDPSDLPGLLEPIARGEADVVYGSRFLGNPHQDPSRLHRFGNWLLTTASNLATGQRLTDMETCYKAFRRTVLDQIDLEQERFGFEPEITAKVSRLGYKILELPISYNSRGYEEGKKIGVRDAINAFWCIARYR